METVKKQTTMSGENRRRVAPTCNWNAVDFRRAEEQVRRLRGRIFRARKRGDVRNVRRLQKLMLRSRSNRILAVRRVAQLNRGKKTPGVDGQTALEPRERGWLVDALSQWRRALPVKRVWIPKAGGKKKRPLGIPVLWDRARQAVVLNALEPEWEAVFEGRSYGFRPAAERGLRRWRAVVTGTGLSSPKRHIIRDDLRLCWEAPSRSRTAAGHG